MDADVDAREADRNSDRDEQRPQSRRKVRQERCSRKGGRGMARRERAGVNDVEGMDLRMCLEGSPAVDEVLDAETDAVGCERHKRGQGDEHSRPESSAPRSQAEHEGGGDPDRAESLHVAKRNEEIVQRVQAMLGDPDREAGVDRAGQPPAFVETSR